MSRAAQLRRQARREARGEQTGGLAGGALGAAAAGAALGTAIMPGLGTVAGGLFGGLFGRKKRRRASIEAQNQKNRAAAEAASGVAPQAPVDPLSQSNPHLRADPMGVQEGGDISETTPQAPAYGQPTFNPLAAQTMGAVADPNQQSPGLPLGGETLDEEIII